MDIIANNVFRRYIANSGNVLYHGTRPALIPNIMEHGLRQDSGFSNHSPEGRHQLGVSLTTDLNTALQFGTAVIVLDADALKRAGYQLNSFSWPSIPNEYEVRADKTIPKEFFLKVLRKSPQGYEKKWWEKTYPDTPLEAI